MYWQSKEENGRCSVLVVSVNNGSTITSVVWGQRVGCAIEGREDGLRIAEVIVDNVHQTVRVHHLHNQLLTGRSVFIELGPLDTQLKGFVLYIRQSSIRRL
jgi:hypothetical protein